MNMKAAPYVAPITGEPNIDLKDPDTSIEERWADNYQRHRRRKEYYSYRNPILAKDSIAVPCHSVTRTREI